MYSDFSAKGIPSSALRALGYIPPLIRDPSLDPSANTCMAIGDGICGWIRNPALDEENKDDEENQNADSASQYETPALLPSFLPPVIAVDESIASPTLDWFGVMEASYEIDRIDECLMKLWSAGLLPPEHSQGAIIQMQVTIAANQMEYSEKLTDDPSTIKYAAEAYKRTIEFAQRAYTAVTKAKNAIPSVAVLRMEDGSMEAETLALANCAKAAYSVLDKVQKTLSGAYRGMLAKVEDLESDNISQSNTEGLQLQEEATDFGSFGQTNLDPDYAIPNVGLVQMQPIAIAAPALPIGQTPSTNFDIGTEFPIALPVRSSTPLPFERTTTAPTTSTSPTSSTTSTTSTTTTPTPEEPEESGLGILALGLIALEVLAT
jgi:hypothetical protein